MIVGGVLVLLGDSVCGIAEWRRVQAREFLIAGADLLAVYSKTVGELLESSSRGPRFITDAKRTPLGGGTQPFRRYSRSD